MSIFWCFQIYWGNHGPATIKVAKQVLQHGRQLRLQSLNNYRVEFGLDRYADFMDMTGDADLAGQLQELYGHVDAVEWFTGEGQHPPTDYLSTPLDGTDLSSPPSPPRRDDG